MKLKIIMIPLLALFLLTINGAPINSGKAKPEFIGIDACKKCHDSPAIGSQYKIWAATPHAKAYQTLLTEEAKAAGKKYNMEDPSNDARCLSCHSTGSGKNMGIVSEGVGCEACHGPGSLYKDFDNHASFDSRENAYRKAIMLGMYPVIGDDSIKAREKLCRHCHTEKRLCITREDLTKKDKRELPLSIIADFIYRHPLRR
ncbi:MAG: cytochrome c family protein [Spirochaetes bacterium]|nr:cytochrome c family protein [Spirochaetota bacterium]